MVWWFFRGIRRGVVTTRYPKGGLDAWASALPSPPAFVPDELTSDIANRLVALCPSGALQRENGVLRFDVGACTSCGRCILAGDGAVWPSGEIELAATKRSDLVKRIPIRGGGP